VRPNGLKITKISVPIGVIGIIYEARPNVTVDAAALCIKSGNGVVLKGGKEAINTNRALINIMKKALDGSAVSPDAIALIDNTSRTATQELMNARGFIDVLIPRGGKGLIKAVVEGASVPVIETGAGNCHIYIDKAADLEKAVKVAINAKTSRPSVCNAVETMLVHKDIAAEFLPKFAEAAKPYNLDMRGCTATREILDVTPATQSDFETEFNDFILAIRVVDSLDDAVRHIRAFGTGHSEAIITEDLAAARTFTEQVDAAAVYVNASTRFTDGGEFGFGAEIGISTQKLHARGPMGLAELTTVKYIVQGDGQVR
jgi:glutamate-5-semialdehyde dehydrogenase